MKVIDLTHTIGENMPFYPGAEAPRLRVLNTVERDCFKETKLELLSHTGTHIDAPAHILADGATLDSFPPEGFIGRALVIDCRDLKRGETITAERILACGKRALEADFLLFNTGWDKKWGTDAYFEGYPCLDESALDLILESDCKGIGVDAVSLDPVSGGLRAHRRLFGSRPILNIENLKDLELIGSEPFFFVCLPIKFENSDGAPARAIAVSDE